MAVVLATKFGMDMEGANGDDSAGRGHPDYVRRACEASLRRLGTDHIDLYQYHEPDGRTPLADTLGAMQALVDEGKVGAIGISNVNAAEIEESAAVTRIASVQNEYNLLNRDLEDEVLPACERLGIGILPYFPLASGRLSGKYLRGQEAPAGTRLHGRDVATDQQFDQLEALAAFAQSREVSMVTVAIGALLAQPVVSSVIAGATRPEQVVQNVAAAAWRPTAADLAEIDTITPPPAE